jgi:hypothetical protein
MMKRFRCSLGASAVLLMLFGGCTQKTSSAYIVVPTTRELIANISTTRDVQAVQQQIPGVGGSTTTTSLSFAKGSAVLSGVVRGPEGPVPGATVVLTRILGDQRVVLRVPTNEDGRYLAPNIKGGVTELFAFKAPSLSAGDGKVIFVSGNMTQDLELQTFSDTEIRWSIGPGQPIVGQQVSVSLQITVRRVDPDGIVRSEPLEGISARVVPLGTLQPVADTERLTNAKGLVSFPMLCTGPGSAAMQVFFATGEETSVEPRECQLPPTTPPDSVPGDTPSTSVGGVDQPLAPGATVPPEAPSSPVTNPPAQPIPTVGA